MQKYKPLSIFQRVDKRTVALLLIAVVLTLSIGSFNSKKFYSLLNFQSMSRQLSEVGIYGLSMFVIVVSGGLNLSIVAVANLSAICGGMIMQGLFLGDIIQTPELRLIVGLMVSVIIGILSGIINGYFVAGLGLTAVLVTSATSQLFQGMALLITKGNAIVGAPRAIEVLGTGNLFSLVPYTLVLCLACYLVAHFIFEKTAYGAQCRLLGANATVNEYSGNSNFKTLMKSYILSGFFSAVGGIVSYARMCALRPDYGTSLTGTAMLVVLMGGAWIIAGGGKVHNIFISLFCIQIISSGLTLGGTSNFTRNTIWGFLLLIILLFSAPQFKAYFERITRGLNIQRGKSG